MQCIVAPESTIVRRRRLDDLARGRLVSLATFMLVMFVGALAESCVSCACARGIMQGMSLVIMQAATKQERKSGDVMNLTILH